MSTMLSAFYKNTWYKYLLRTYFSRHLNSNDIPWSWIALNFLPMINDCTKYFLTDWLVVWNWSILTYFASNLSLNLCKYFKNVCMINNSSRYFKPVSKLCYKYFEFSRKPKWTNFSPQNNSKQNVSGQRVTNCDSNCPFYILQWPM